MGKNRITIPAEFEGKRADVALCALRSDIGRRAAREMFQAGAVLLNQKKTKASTKVAFGDQLLISDGNTIQNSESKRRLRTPHGVHISRIFETDDLLVVNKPAGLSLYSGDTEEGGGAIDTVADALAEGYGEDGWHWVHRLDKDTSGCLVVAKSKEIAKKLEKEFRRREVIKEYVLIVKGVPTWDEYVIQRPLKYMKRGETLSGDTPLTSKQRREFQRGRQWSPRLFFSGAKKVLVCPEDAKGSGIYSAETKFVVKERLGKYSLLLCRPKTGRTHQIRAHAAALGFPPALDPLYGRKRSLRVKDLVGGTGKNQKWASTEQEEENNVVLSRVPLHAKSISIMGGQYRSPIPSDLRKFLALLRT